jgi:NhaA family Na+:H+ antiporter
MSVTPFSDSSVFARLLASEAAGGLALMAATVVAMLIANSPAAPAYFAALHWHGLGLSLQHWVDDGLMAGFFLLIGLEIKRELVGGELAEWHARILPGISAIAGMAVPAAIYLLLNASDPETRVGWAIPAATDIAFSLGILALLGARVPPSLKFFLTAVAVLDDLLAILVIAFFYTPSLSPLMLALAAVVFAALVLLNRLRVMALWPYLLLGLALWACVLGSGIHATLAGVLLALTIPLRRGPNGQSPLHRLEHAIQPWIALLVLPIFGLANAGVPLGGLSLPAVAHPVTLGVGVGLFLGKQVGIFAAVALAAAIGVARPPPGASWGQIYGVALLCGIGFTMSLFIGLLAFPTQEALQQATKLGVLGGSLLSGVAGWALLRFSPAMGGSAAGVPAGRTPPR